MAITDYNVSASLNLLLGSIAVGEGMDRDQMNDAIRQLMADIAALPATGGADLIGISTGGTVQDFIDTAPGAGDFIDLSTPVSVSSATALSASQLNKMVICDGATAYTVNLPSVSLSDVGKAVKIEIARTCTVAVTIQAAAASGLNIDAQSSRVMIAGESALFIYRGAIGWTRQDFVEVPVRAEMRKSGATSLTISSWTDIPMTAAGTQLMDQDLKAIWGYSGGYFTAPRDGIYNVKGSFWIEQTGAPGQLDIGAYVASSGGGAPATENFTRVEITAYTYQTVDIDLTFKMTAGQKLFQCLRPQSDLTTASVVDSATVMSKVVVTELQL